MAVAWGPSGVSMGCIQVRLTEPHEDASGGEEYIYHLDCGDGLTEVHLCQNLLNCTLQYVQFVVRQSHLSKSVKKRP